MEWDLINWVITAIFAIDCVVNLRTTYLDHKEGEEIRDGRMMAKNYLMSFRFYIDFLSTIPFDIMLQSVVTSDVQAFLAALGMLKLFRASRISTIIARLKYNREVKAFYKLLLLIFSLIMFLHITGCLFYFITRQ